MTTPDDRDLKAAFQTLGRMVQDQAPPFPHLVSGAALSAARWRRRRRAALLGTVLAIPVASLLLARTDRGLDYAQFTAVTGLDLNEVTWNAPSDVLLDVPGRDLLTEVPVIQVLAPRPAPDSARSPNANDTTRRPRS